MRCGWREQASRDACDDVSILYVQDILVDPEQQGRGIGSDLLATCLDRYARDRQKVLLINDDLAQRALYRRFGARPTTEFGPPPLHAYVRFDA